MNPRKQHEVTTPLLHAQKRGHEGVELFQEKRENTTKIHLKIKIKCSQKHETARLARPHPGVPKKNKY